MILTVKSFVNARTDFLTFVTLKVNREREIIHFKHYVTLFDSKDLCYKAFCFHN